MLVRTTYTENNFFNIIIKKLKWSIAYILKWQRNPYFCIQQANNFFVAAYKETIFILILKLI